ncbi:RDD family protein [Kocuria rosea]|uniref:RDD family protein n=1 Tax=Kocuria rosea TaxID=1275 RepID=UPI00203BDBF7|nr:RDD family protein [Kocuria rosea]
MSQYQPQPSNYYSDIALPDNSAGESICHHGYGYFRGERLASVPHRLLALAVDVGLIYIVWKFFDLIIPESWRTLDGIADFIGICLALAVAVLNLVVLQSKTGQSVGKMLFGMVVVHPIVDPMNMERHNYVYPTVWMMAGRTLVHYFADLFFLVGLIFMVRSPHKLSLADHCCNTLVLRPFDLDAVTIARGLRGARDR